MTQPSPAATNALELTHPEGNGNNGVATEETKDPNPSSNSKVSFNIATTTGPISEEDALIARTPNPPYYAVIFSSVRTDDAATNEDYAKTAGRMVELAAQQEGFLGAESAREDVGVTVSYWRDTKSIKNWKSNCEHLVAQDKGKKQWYSAYKTRVCKVERDYGFFASKQTY